MNQSFTKSLILNDFFKISNNIIDNHTIVLL
nr:MAG TPA: hypothetical protein [Caudoviricetes sp.]